MGEGPVSNASLMEIGLGMLKELVCARPIELMIRVHAMMLVLIADLHIKKDLLLNFGRAL